MKAKKRMKRAADRQLWYDRQDNNYQKANKRPGSNKKG